jgi:imidazolonepropionase-like amidohydrolase
MLDVVSGEIKDDAVIVVEGRIITALNPDRLPPGAAVIDLGDMTLLPGLVDLHTHLGYDIEGDWVNRAVRETAADAAFRAARNAGKTLMAGFTTVRDVGSSRFTDVALMRAVEAGFVPGPWVFPAGHSLGITGGHCDVTGYAPGIAETGPEQGIADGPGQLLRAVRYQVKHGARLIKICATAGVLSFEGPVGAQQFSQEEMETIVAEAARHGMSVAAHAHGAEGIKAAVLAGVRSIEHGSLLDAEGIRLMKERGTFLVPTTYLADAIDLEALPAPIRAKAEFVLPRARENLKAAIREGVRIGFGTDAAVYPHGGNAKEFAVLVSLGMAPLEAIRSATLHAVELLGVEDRGVLAVNRLADVVAVPGNPLEDITVTERIEFVMRGGVVFKAPGH